MKPQTTAEAFEAFGQAAREFMAILKLEAKADLVRFLKWWLR